MGMLVLVLLLRQYCQTNLDCLVIDQAVHRNCRTLVICSVRLLPERCSPSCCLDGEPSVEEHRDRCDRCKIPAELPGEDTTNHGNLESSGDHVEDDRGKDEGDTPVYMIS